MTDEILIAREHDRTGLRAAVKAGSLERVRRGAYRPTTSAATWADRRELALDRIRAVHAQLRATHVFSHVSAALVWGSPVWEIPVRVHVRQRYRAGGASATDIVRHRPLPAGRVMIDDLPVTTAPETVADCLMSAPPLHGLVIADWSLGKICTVEEVCRVVAGRAQHQGHARAELLLDLADGGAQSAWETWLRYLALRVGLPRPQTQCPVETADGTFHTDLGWPEHGVLVEFDGRVKYTDGAFGPAYDAERALFDEKTREDAIMAATGARVARFTARGAKDPARVSRRLLSLFPPQVRAAARVNPRLPLP
ncbi:hypothetical protein [Isoptericola croceus]|uniref:hypothetical protein n=1 Tax=Isoptericola croceus TaxID=3031406 RepID=UPI0023F84936|nr:hypothetical protein [Isoptericola croceus]